MLTVYVDFKSPACYLAMKPTWALVERTGVEVRWRPYVTRQSEPPMRRANETVGDSHRRVRAESRRAIHVRYAAHQGIDLRFPQPLGETDLALGVLAMLDEDPWRYLEAAFDAYWSAHADLDDPDTVAAVLAACGPAYERFVAGVSRAREVLARAQMDAEERGIVDAPAYLVDDELFIGREHLPWIEERLQSGSGSDLDGG